MENFAKSVLKAMMSKVMLFAIPIIVFFIGLVMALSVGDSSSSSSASDNDNYGNMSLVIKTLLIIYPKETVPIQIENFLVLF